MRPIGWYFDYPGPSAMAIAPPVLPTSPNDSGESTGALAKVVGGNRPWLHVAFGICVAGAAYPMLVVAIFSLIGFCVTAIQLFDMQPQAIGTQIAAAVPMVLAIGMMGVAAGCVGALWT